ncbi:MAG: AI-2E family transporter [Candidatus Pacebacteria bacterium]|nr:AI-2E family transporter [Candidatus Paceibacterota bacterium]
MNETTHYKLHMDWQTVAKLALLVICLYLIFILKDVIIWFVFALVISVLFNFLIDGLQKRRVPRIVSTTVLYLGFFALLGFFIYKTAPILLYEIQEFIASLPAYLKKISPFFEKLGITSFKNSKLFLGNLQDSLNSAGGSFTNAMASIFGGAASTALVIAMAFFISLEKQFVEKILSAFSPPQYKEYLFGLWRRSKKKVSGWFVTRLIGIVFVGLGMYVVLMILNVKYAFILAVIAGVLDLLPFIGPLVAGVALFAVVSLISFPQALFVVLAFFIIQEIENHILFPIIFKKLIGLSPVLVLVAFAVGGELWGASGAILGIPLAGVVYEIIKDYLIKRQRHELPEQSNE